MTRLDFTGKEFVYNHHLSVSYSVLQPDIAKSLVQKGEQAKLDGNLIIHGDNLRALKALLPRYEGRVNCIYIDPPYNTGNGGWCYNDNVNMPYLTEWLSNNPVNQEDMQRHEKWCCMMWPRLTLLRQLLADDGVIFISIDDNEVHHLRMLMDEIFGEDNFIANIIWHKKYAPANDAKYFSDTHDYILCYAKIVVNGTGIGWTRKLLPREEKQDRLYKHDDNDGKGLWRHDNLTAKTYSEKYNYAIINEGKEHYPPQGSCWRTSQENMEKWIAEGRVIFGRDGKGAPILKRYLSEVQQGIVPTTIWGYEEVGHTDGSRKLLKSIFSDEQLPFDNPKPVNLIKNIITIASGKDSIILDSFAGSGTTAHAVLQLNKEDAGKRKFILVECEDYADSITAERVRRVIRGVPAAKDELLKNGLGGDFTFCELGASIDFDALLAAKVLPAYIEFAALVWNLFSDTAFDEKQCVEKEFLLGEKDGQLVFCFYKPDKKFLLSNESCLNTTRMEELVSAYPDKEIVVYAPACFVPNAMLAMHNMKFAYLPFALFKLG